MVIVEAVDYGNAPEIPVRGPCIIDRISAGQMRVSYYATFRGPNGELENRVVAHHIWDREEFLAVIAKYAAVWEEVETALPNDSKGFKARMMAH